MSIYSYKARNKGGQVFKGLIDAPSEDVVAGLLAEKGLVIIDIERKEAGDLGSFSFGFFHSVKIKDLVIFFRQLSVMIEANLPIVKSLRILIKQTENPYLKTVVADITDNVDGGGSLSSAMEVFPKIFPPFYTNIIRSGETSGRLSEVLSYLADQQEKDYELQSKIKGAMVYPAFIVSGLLIVGFIVMTFVVPQMTAMIKESGTELPFITKALIFISGIFSSYWWLMIAAFFGLSFLFISYTRTSRGKKEMDLIKINLPIFGSIFRYIYIVRITQSFSTLIKGGVPIARALEIVKNVVDNRIYYDMITETIKEVEEGNPIAESFSRNTYVPTMVSQMIAIGEETGKLEEVLERVTEFYTREVSSKVANLSVLIEPLIMVVLGVAVGFFVAAIILPMWQLSASM